MLKSNLATAPASPTRRRFLSTATVAVAATATGASAIALTRPDPIFAAIERHRAAFVGWGDVLARQDILPDDALIRVEEEAARLAESETLMAIFVTGPATVDGARAALDYLSGLDEDDHIPNVAWMVRNSPLLAT
jgi:hypothetical protein